MAFLDTHMISNKCEMIADIISKIKKQTLAGDFVWVITL